MATTTPVDILDILGEHPPEPRSHPPVHRIDAVRNPRSAMAIATPADLQAFADRKVDRPTDEAQGS